MTYLAEGPRMTFFGVDVDYYRRDIDGDRRIGAPGRLCAVLGCWTEATATSGLIR